MNDLKFALRQLRKNPGFTAVAVMVLTLGIGANTAIFSLINAFLFKPIVARQPERMVGVYSHDVKQDGSWRGFSIPDFRDLRANNDVFEDVFAMMPGQAGLTEGETTRRVRSLNVSANFLDVFGLHPFLGRAFLAGEDSAPTPVVMVSHRWWQLNGADPRVVGRTLRINGGPRTIVGVTPPGFSGTTLGASPELYFPLGATLLAVTGGSNPLLQRDNYGYILVGRLKPGLDLAGANTRLKVISDQLANAFPEPNKNQLITVDRLPRMSISNSPQHDRDMLGTIGALIEGLAGAVLLIACLNLANMLLSRGMARRREMAVRIAIGATRGQIVRQLLVEAFVLSLLGGGAGMLLASSMTSWMSRSLERIASVEFSIPTATQLPVLLVTFGACPLATVLFGLGPALRSVRHDVNHDLKVNPGEESHSSGRRFFLVRNALVVGQIAFSLALLVAAGLLGRSAFNAMRFDPGFNMDGGILAELDGGLAGYTEKQTRQRYSEVIDRVSRLPGVASVSLAATVPMGELSLGEGVQLAGAPFPPPRDAKSSAEGSSVGASLNVIGPDYFRTLGVPLQRGREFTRAEFQPRAGSPVAIIDTELAKRLWPGGEALGRHIQIGSGDGAPGGDGNGADGARKSAVTVLEVVGIVPPLKQDLFEGQAQPALYLPYGQRLFAAMNLHVRAQSGSGMAALPASIRTAIHQLDPNLPVLKIQTLRNLVATNVETWMMRTGAFLFGSLGAAALLLALLGVYGVKAYSVARRTREIGIRMALGSTTGEVISLFLRDGLKLTLAGLAIGSVIAIGVSLAMGSILFDVNRFDPVIYVAAPLFLGFASLAATWLPARRATRVNPLQALRNE